MPSISLPTLAVVGAGITAAGSIGSASIAAGASKNAANTQLKMFNTINQQESPFREFGQATLGPLNNLLSGNPQTVMGELSQLPGYQFALTQGLKSTQSGATARGLGVSGAADKAAAQYATGLADQTYTSRIQNLLAGATLGQDAAAQTGVAGTALAGNAGQFQSNAGGQLGAGFQGAAGALAYPFYSQAYGANPSAGWVGAGGAWGGGPGVLASGQTGLPGLY